MDVRIVDRDALSAIPRASLRAYLLGSGWASEGTWGDYAEVLAIETDGGKLEIAVPLRETARTYANEIGQAIDLLSQIEERSQLDVHADIVAAGADVITLGALNETHHPPISLHQSAHMQTEAAAMITAAARAAERHRHAFAGGLSDTVRDFLESVELAPSSPERFGVTLLVPVGSRIGQSDLFDDDRTLPFGRRASTVLDRALGELGSAVSAATAEDRLDPFERSVESGVSANLCQAMAKLADRSSIYGDGISVSLRWAAVRQPNGRASNSYQFGKNEASILLNASEFLREKAPDQDQHLIADIVHLDSEYRESFQGQAVIMADLGGKPTALHTIFSKADQDKVLKAFKSGIIIEVDGDVVHEGRRRELRNPANVRLLGNGRT